MKRPGPQTGGTEFVGPYRLGERLGRGGMAEVYSAAHLGAAGFERTVCIKRIIPELADDGEFRALFIREATVAGRLCHSNLVQVFDSIEDGPTLAIVMEMVLGMDLRDLLRIMARREESLPHGLIAHIAGQVLTALGYAHSRKVVHRDVSPHNILLSRYGEVKLADFGVAKAMLSQATRTGDLKGKLAYMSPEQAMGNPVDHRTDLYSLGLVLYELIMGERFFTAESQAELIGAVTHAKQPKLDGVDEALATVVERLLAPDAGDRFQSADEAILHLPPWEVIGPAGAVELRALLVRLEPDHRAIRREATERTSASVVPIRGDDSTPLPEETEVVPGSVESDRMERPVIPGPRNAPTATREDDVRKAIGMLPTEEFDELEEASSDAALGLTRTGLLAAPSAAPPSEVGHRGLLIGVGVGVGLVALVVGLLIGTIATRPTTVDGDDSLEQRVQPETSEAPTIISSPQTTPAQAEASSLSNVEPPGEAPPSSSAVAETPAQEADTPSTADSALEPSPQQSTDQQATQTRTKITAQPAGNSAPSRPRQPPRPPQKRVREGASQDPFSVPLIR